MNYYYYYYFNITNLLVMPTLVRFRDLHESNWVGLKGFFQSTPSLSGWEICNQTQLITYVKIKNQSNQTQVCQVGLGRWIMLSCFIFKKKKKKRLLTYFTFSKSHWWHIMSRPKHKRDQSITKTIQKYLSIFSFWFDGMMVGEGERDGGVCVFLCE